MATLSAEVLSIEQLRRQYDGEWVLVADPQRDAAGRLTAGRPACHARDRDELYRLALALDPKPARVASLYFGPLPDDAILNLNVAG